MDDALPPPLSAAVVMCHENGFVVSVQPSVYTLEVILGVSHRYTAKCFVHVQQAHSNLVEVRFQQRGSEDVGLLAKEFCNELLDGRLRDLVARESQAERDLILAHALSRHPLLNRELEGAEAFSDPAGVLLPDLKCRA